MTQVVCLVRNLLIYLNSNGQITVEKQVRASYLRYRNVCQNIANILICNFPHFNVVIKEAAEVT